MSHIGLSGRISETLITIINIHKILLNGDPV